MFRPKELYIGLRYTRAKRRNGFVSFIALMSILGIALGVAVLIVVLAVMNGFGKELKERTLGMTSHATISGPGGRLENWRWTREQIKNQRYLVDSAPYTQAEAMLSRGNRVRGAFIRGILPNEEPRVSDIDHKMVSGQLEDLKAGEFGIILGRELANALGVFEGEKITMITPQASITPVGVLPRLRRFTVVGVFEVGMNEYDGHGALIHLNDAQKLYSLDHKVNGLRLKLTDMFKARTVANEIENSLGQDYWVLDWTNMHSNIFKALKTEKVAMFILLLLMIAVAAFNIVSTLIMTVKDKQADIAILRTIGMTPGSLMMVFIIQGVFIGFIGTLLGVVFGVPLALNVNNIVGFFEQLFQTKFMPADIYYITQISGHLKVSEVIIYSLSAFTLTVLATIYPAWRASKIQPVDALRYE